MMHVVPKNDFVEHEDSLDCWCKPTVEDGVCIHNSLDGRELWDGILLQYGEIPRFLSEVSQMWITQSEPQNDNQLTSKIWLDKRVSILTNMFGADARIKALEALIEYWVKPIYLNEDSDTEVIDSLIKDLFLNDLKPIHLKKISSGLKIPFSLVLKKYSNNNFCILDKKDVEWLTFLAWEKEKITISKVAELLNIDTASARKWINER